MNPQDRLNLLERYLDGLLPEAEREAFEREIESDPDLRGAVERQERLDVSLRRMFEAPSRGAALPSAGTRGEGQGEGSLPGGRVGLPPSDNGNGKDTVSPPLRIAPPSIRPAEKSKRMSPWRLYAPIAAAVLIALGLVAWLTREKPGDEYPEMAWRSIEMVYRIETQKGFKPLWKCETDREFATAYWKNLEQALVLPLPELPKEIEPAGLSYTNTFSPKTVLLFARVRGVPVIVFADRLERDTRPTVSAESGLRVHRREIGELVLYEVSPLPQAQVMPYLRSFPMPEGWKE